MRSLYLKSISGCTIDAKCSTTKNPVLKECKKSTFDDVRSVGLVVESVSPRNVLQKSCGDGGEGVRQTTTADDTTYVVTVHDSLFASASSAIVWYF